MFLLRKIEKVNNFSTRCRCSIGFMTNTIEKFDFKFNFMIDCKPTQQIDILHGI